MIVSFACKDTEKIFNEVVPKKFKLPPNLLKKSLDKLRILNAVGDINDLRIPPSNRLEALKGDRKGQFSIRINIQWRICFKFEDGHASDVIIIDYH
jgi:addiction module HigA family antidote